MSKPQGGTEVGVKVKKIGPMKLVMILVVLNF